MRLFARALLIGGLLLAPFGALETNTTVVKATVAYFESTTKQIPRAGASRQERCCRPGDVYEDVARNPALVFSPFNNVERGGKSTRLRLLLYGLARCVAANLPGRTNKEASALQIDVRFDLFDQRP